MSGPAAGAANLDAFDLPWLDLREPADHAARRRAASEVLLPQRRLWRVLDLGGGTGSSLRYLMPRLGGEQHWILVDHDPRLLAAAPLRLRQWALAQGGRCRLVTAASAPSAGELLPWRRMVIEAPGWQAHICPLCADLKHFDQWPLWVEDGAAAAVDLVSASALLDLVSAHWLDRLTDWAVQRSTAMLFALNFDGRVRWQPACDGDARVSRALNRDQARDKGLGPALGAAAPAHLAQRLATMSQRAPVRYSWQVVDSDWELSDADLQARLVRDWSALAASAEHSGHADDHCAQRWVNTWARDRLARIAAGCSSLQVGHQDLVAWPRSTAAAD